jgi:ABC-2 type transport system permease protein
MQPLPGLVAVAGCLVTAMSTSLIELWRQRPGKRSEFRRSRGSSVVIPLIEVLVGLSYGGAVAMLVTAIAEPDLWGLAVAALIPLIIAVVVVWACKPPSAKLAAV